MNGGVEWTVCCKPVEKGLIISISNDDREYEVSRVAFDRTQGRNPGTPFHEALAHHMDKAHEAVVVLNALADEYEAIRKEEREKARKQIREILGRARPGFA